MKKDNGKEKKSPQPGSEDRVVRVELAPGMKAVIARRQVQKEQEAQAWQDLLEMAGMLTDFQLEACVMEVDPNDPVRRDAARFFLQELARRDKARALEVFRKWREGGKGQA